MHVLLWQDLLAAFVEQFDQQDAPEQSWALGRTLVFYTEEFKQEMEKARVRLREQAAVTIQTAARKYLCVKHWPYLRSTLRQAKLQGQE